MSEYIGFVIVLFLLSLICERFADFLKNYLSEASSGWGCALKKLLKIGDLLSKKPVGSVEEERRAYRILKINIWCGFVTAWALHADLFSIIRHKEDPFNAIGWNNVQWFWETGFIWKPEMIINVLVFIVGCFATGLFISFGSKFWHDLLDILYQVKNYRRLLADPDTYLIDNIKSFDRVLSTYQSDFIKAAFLEAKPKFMAMENVKAISLKADSEGYYFEISAKKPDPEITSRYQFFLDDATPQSIRIKMIILGEDEIIAHTVDLSGKIFDLNQPAKWGTLGCLVKPTDGTDKTYIMTCCHNVIHPISKLSAFKPGKIDVGTSEADVSPVGVIEKAIRDHEIDAALIEVDPAKLAFVSNRMPEMGPPNKKRILLKDDVNKVTTTLYGARSKQQNGIVASLYSDIKITYAADEFQIINLIAISNNGKAVSKPGDSGSVVFDDDNNVLGLVVAGNTRETYIIPIETLLIKLNVQLA